MEKEITSIRKIKLTIISDDKDEAYKFIRDEQYKQNKALNMAMTHMWYNYTAKEKIKLADETYVAKERAYQDLIDRKYAELKKAKTDKAKEAIKKSINTQTLRLNKHRLNASKEAREIYTKAIGTPEKTNVRDLIRHRFPDMLGGTLDRVGNKVEQDFKNDMAEILRGERSIRNYRRTNPLMIRANVMKFYTEDNETYLKWVKGIIFKIIIGRKDKDRIELEYTLHKVVNSEYKVCDSLLKFDKDNQLILILTLEIPVRKHNNFVENRVVGVDLGMKIPAYVSLNDVAFIKRSIGDISDFLRVRQQMQSRRRGLQRALQSTKGGKGRTKKMQALDSLKVKEKNFVTTYNHFLSKAIIQFALKNKAGQINLEKLTKDGFDQEKILRNWSYYQLQSMIEYKAKRENIIVKYVDPYHTSQTCSECGHWEEGQRLEQETFICKSCGFKSNADYNASRNIAKSTKYK